tara:strand:+ start:2498 stop:2887 length:390 start_codon:yes stop_codon:yes gene_type:complete
MITIVAGVIVWFILIVLILRFFAVCSEAKRSNCDSKMRNPDLHIERDTQEDKIALLFYGTLLKLNETTLNNLDAETMTTEHTELVMDVRREIDIAREELGKLLPNESEWTQKQYSNYIQNQDDSNHQKT